MKVYRKLPVPVEAIQFDGHNFEAVRDFVGTRRIDKDEFVSRFHPIGTYLASTDSEDDVAELWVEAVERWLPVEVGDWIVRDEFDIYPLRNEVFLKSYALEEDFDFPGDVKGDVVPVLDETASDARMMGRIRLSLLLTRPVSEVDLISERLLALLTRAHRETHSAHTLFRVRQVIQSQTLGRLTDQEVDDVINALQNAGILFREKVPGGAAIHG